MACSRNGAHEGSTWCKIFQESVIKEQKATYNELMVVLPAGQCQEQLLKVSHRQYMIDCRYTGWARESFHIWKFIAPRVFEWIKFYLKAERLKYLCGFLSGFYEHWQYRWIRFYKNVLALSHLYHIYHTNLYHMKNTWSNCKEFPRAEQDAGTFNLPQELWKINFQTDTNIFQSHGNKCAHDISYRWKNCIFYCSMRGVSLQFDQVC